MGIYAALGVASGLFAFGLSLNIRQARLEWPYYDRWLTILPV